MTLFGQPANAEPMSAGAATSEDGARVLAALDRAGIPGLQEAERGDLYRVYLPADRGGAAELRRRYTGGVAAGLCIAVVFVALLASAAAVPWILLLLVAPLPLLPLLASPQPHVAVSAVAEGGATVVTVHGEVTPEARAALDVFLASLPAPVAAEPVIATAAAPA